MKTCTSIEELRDLVVLEQLPNKLPEDARFLSRKGSQRPVWKLVDWLIIILQREWRVAEKGEEGNTPDRHQSLRCGKCWKLSHLAPDCIQSQLKLEREKDKGEVARKPKRDLKNIE